MERQPVQQHERSEAADPKPRTACSVRRHARTRDRVRHALDSGQRWVCLIGPAGSGEEVVIEMLRRELPGFVGVLGAPPVDGMWYALTHCLALRTGDEDEHVTQRRLRAFAAVLQARSEPLTVIVKHAESLQRAQIEEAREFLKPMQGRLVLCGRPELSALLDEAAAHGCDRPESVFRLNAPEESETPPGCNDSRRLARPDWWQEAQDASEEGDTPGRATGPRCTPRSVARLGARDVPPLLDTVVEPDGGAQQLMEMPSRCDVRTTQRAPRSRWQAGHTIFALVIGGVLGFALARGTATSATGPWHPTRALAVWVDGLPSALDAARERLGTALQRAGAALYTAGAQATRRPPAEAPTAGARIAATAPRDATHDAAVPNTARDAADQVSAHQPSSYTAPSGAHPHTPLVEAADARPDDAQTAPRRDIASLPHSFAVRQRTARLYAERARYQEDRGRYDRALLNVIRGLDVAPGDRKLQALRHEILAAMERWARTGRRLRSARTR